MSEPVALALLFLPHVADPARSALGPVEALEARLADLWQRARTAWPEVDLPPAGFMKHLAERLTGPGEPARTLEAVHAGDLYLAYGCALGDPGALGAFERRFIPQVAAYLGRRDALAGFTDELKQQLRARLLVAEQGLLPRISAYSGRGPLGAWLRVAAARLAINMQVAERPTVELHDEDPVLRTVADDPELAHLRARYAPALRDAIRDALAALEPREATVLRLFFLESMTHAAIGGVLRMSERSVRRSVAEARARILELTRKRLSETLAIPEPELDTIIRLARDELAPSIVMILKESGQD